MLDDKEKPFLDLLTHYLWRARRQGAITGMLYALVGAGLVYLAVEVVGPLNPLSALAYGWVAVMVYDFWRRVIRRPGAHAQEEIKRRLAAREK